MNKPLLDMELARSAMAFNRQQLSPGLLRLNADPATDSAEVFIYGDIGGWWDGVQAVDFTKEVASLDVSRLHARINSGGGSVFDGIAIYNALAQHKAEVTISIEGIAASIASVIAMAGDEIQIAEGAHMMIHKPWSGLVGDAVAFRKEADILDKLESSIIDLYAARTEQDRKALEDWVAAETWFKGKEAVDHGFADTLLPAKSKKSARSSMLQLFTHTPADLLDDGEVPPVREIERLLRDGEGFSRSQAKRVAALIAREFPSVLREAEPIKPDDPGRDARIAGVTELDRLSAFLRSL